MKIRIDTPMARLTADLPEDQVKELLQIAIGYVTGGQQSRTLSMKEVIAKAMSDPEPEQPAPMVTFVGQEPRPIQAKQSYKGFLYIKCEACGTTKGFCAKTPTTKHRCTCGHETEIRNLKPLYVNCKCGASFKYQTNITDNYASIDCIQCGAPVDLEYHEKQDTYVTIGRKENWP